MFWIIEYYKTPGGQEVIEEFIDNLQENTQARLGRQLDLLQHYGYELGMPHVKALGNGLMELRVRGKNSQEVRVFYIFGKENHIYLLHAFVKKSQTTPKKELEIARKRQAEINMM